ncbi:MAG TPA: arginine--tRNA ligase [Planctomycetota bacterium]|nr:arginine--tRNA ligase [Planctomycetota bacterium]
MLLDELAATARQALSELLDGAEAPPVTVEFADDAKLGDVVVNCFHLAKALKRPPPALAAALAPKLVGRGAIAEASAASGYVNVTVRRDALFRGAAPAARDAARAGASDVRAGRRLLVEFSAPNTNKPQHLGHLRNNFLGDAVARLLEAAGASVVRVNLINDRGIHICKSMLAYLRFGERATPSSTGMKGDHFVGKWYVAFEKAFQAEADAYVAAHPEEYAAWAATRSVDKKGRPRPEAELRAEWRASFKEENFGKVPLGAAAQQMLRDWEAGDPDVVALWKTMNGWVLAGFDETYRKLGIRFDKVYLESETYRLGRDLILRGLERGVFKRRADGATEIDLSADGLGRKVVLRSDGTSVYITQDIGTTVRKAEEFGADGQIWVVADEQRFHFQALFAILARMGYPWAKSLQHLAYGMVHLPEGRMKSREGTVVDADDLLAEVADLAREEIVRRDPEISPAALDERAGAIALAALKFMLLKVTPATTMTYDPKESVSFDGETGPYLLYTYARIRRMLVDGAWDADKAADAFDAGTLGHASETALALEILKFRRAVDRAARDCNPAALCQYLVGLAQTYNTYYQDVPILKVRASNPALCTARLTLSAAAANVVARGLELLGIGVVDKM